MKKESDKLGQTTYSELAAAIAERIQQSVPIKVYVLLKLSKTADKIIEVVGVYSTYPKAQEKQMYIKDWTTILPFEVDGKEIEDNIPLVRRQKGVDEDE